MPYVPEWIKELLTPDNVRVFVGLVKKAFSKPTRVLAVGSTGTGKTTLLDALEQQLIPRMIEEINRTRFAQERKIKIKKSTIKIMDTPGHRIDPDDEGSPYLNPQFTRAINKGPYIGVLNVVSYGYHQYDVSPRPDFSQEKVSSFLREHRKRELIGLSPHYSRRLLAVVAWRWHCWMGGGVVERCAHRPLSPRSV